jgi:transcriptional regulator with XRE-family HTH domain
MVDLAKNLARKLKRLRGEETQRAFAKKLGITHPHLNRIEQAKENITLKTIQKMCDRLGYSIGRLFDGR